MCAPRVSVCARGRMKCPPPWGQLSFRYRRDQNLPQSISFYIYSFFIWKGTLCRTERVIIGNDMHVHTRYALLSLLHSKSTYIFQNFHISEMSIPDFYGAFAVERNISRYLVRCLFQLSFLSENMIRCRYDRFKYSFTN